VQATVLIEQGLVANRAIAIAGGFDLYSGLLNKHVWGNNRAFHNGDYTVDAEWVLQVFPTTRKIFLRELYKINGRSRQRISCFSHHRR